MGWFRYKCPQHGDFIAVLPKRTKTYICPICAQESPALITVGSSRVVERLDNGAMARAVERLADIKELIKERNEKHDEQIKVIKESEDDTA
jgi:hypothetical protein